MHVDAEQAGAARTVRCGHSLPVIRHVVTVRVVIGVAFSTFHPRCGHSIGEPSHEPGSYAAQQRSHALAPW